MKELYLGGNCLRRSYIQKEVAAFIDTIFFLLRSETPKNPPKTKQKCKVVNVKE